MLCLAVIIIDDDSSRGCLIQCNTLTLHQKNLNILFCLRMLVKQCLVWWCGDRPEFPLFYREKRRLGSDSANCAIIDYQVWLLITFIIFILNQETINTYNTFNYLSTNYESMKLTPLSPRKKTSQVCLHFFYNFLCNH